MEAACEIGVRPWLFTAFTSAPVQACAGARLLMRLRAFVHGRTSFDECGNSVPAAVLGGKVKRRSPMPVSVSHVHAANHPCRAVHRVWHSQSGRLFEKCSRFIKLAAFKLECKPCGAVGLHGLVAVWTRSTDTGCFAIMTLQGHPRARVLSFIEDRSEEVESRRTHAHKGLACTTASVSISCTVSDGLVAKFRDPNQPAGWQGPGYLESVGVSAQ